MLASMYGERSVLAILPPCIKDKVVTWFYGLEDEVSAIIADSIDEWKIQLIRRFHTNPSQALVKADRMHRSFEDESELDVREYISRRHGLYMDAGETNQDNIVRRIHDSLDPTNYDLFLPKKKRTTQRLLHLSRRLRNLIRLRHSTSTRETAFASPPPSAFSEISKQVYSE